MKRISLFLLASSLALGCANLAFGQDYQKIADTTPWAWTPERASITDSFLKFPNTYHVELIRKKNKYGEITIRLDALGDIPIKEQSKDPPKDFTNSIGMKFVWIPPGSFMMGSPKNEPGREEDEFQHKVTLTKGFYIGVYAVTQEEMQAVVGNNLSRFKDGKNLPVENLSWDDCQYFVKKMRDKDKKLYRLPSEAEWEYACRAGTKTAYYFGDDHRMLGQCAWHRHNSSEKTHPVGQRKPNAWGLYDMHGNVWQWCQDRYGSLPQKDLVDPQGPDKGVSRVLRGGSFDANTEDCRSASRIRHGIGTRSHNFGVRVCFFVE